MAKLIYAFAALAAASLVAGFLIRSTNVPLFISIGLSALITVLILGGWSKRLREGAFGEGETQADIEELEAVALDDVEPVEIAAEPVARPSRRAQATIELPAATPEDRRRAKAVTQTRERKGKRAAPRPTRVAQKTKRPARVMVIPGRSRYHTADCRFAKGDEVREVAEATARRRGYEPCNVCKPDAR